MEQHHKEYYKKSQILGYEKRKLKNEVDVRGNGKKIKAAKIKWIAEQCGKVVQLDEKHDSFSFP